MPWQAQVVLQVRGEAQTASIFRLACLLARRESLDTMPRRWFLSTDCFTSMTYELDMRMCSNSSSSNNSSYPRPTPIFLLTRHPCPAHV